MQLHYFSYTTFHLPYAGTFATAHGSAPAREGVLLRLVAAGGLEGLGEASPVPAFGGGTLDDVLRMIAIIAPRLIGRDLSEADELLTKLDYTLPGVAAAACALDTAICDLRAQAAGVPLAALLGGDAARSVLVNATIGAPEPADAALSARRAAEAGFKSVKLKVSITRSHDAELGRIAAVRQALGPSIRLRLDANGAWGVEEAIAFIRAAERFELELVEQPVRPDDLAGMARVRAAVATPIAADESVAGPEQAHHVIDAGAADVLVVKPILAGGLRRAREVIALAQAAGLQALVTSTIDSGIGVAAALHLAATLPAPALACGLATGPLLAADLLAEPLVARDGFIVLPEAPGLGVRLDERQIARYCHGWYEVA
jgi:o-succinylbenzoate synthase